MPDPNNPVMQAALERFNSAVKNGTADEINAALADFNVVRAAGKTGLQFLSLDEFAVRPAVSWLVRDIIPAESIVVVFGAPKSGKTHAIVDMVMHGACGMHWHGHTITRPLRIAYLAGEGHPGLRARLHAWRKHHEAELRGDMRVMPEALPLVTRIADILAMLSPYKPDLIIADTLNAYFGGADENRFAGGWPSSSTTSRSDYTSVRGANDEAQADYPQATGRNAERPAPCNPE